MDACFAILNARKSCTPGAGCYTPAMSRPRRIYCICYSLMILGLAALIFLPSPLPELPPQEKWSSFQAWLSPPRRNW